VKLRSYLTVLTLATLVPVAIFAAIAVISGDARVAKRDYLETARLLGADATLPKPFEPDALIRALRAL